MTHAVAFQPFTGDAGAWAELCHAFPDRPLVQSWTHGAARAATGPWRAERGVFRDADNAVVGVVQAMVRPAPLRLGRLVWIARGPVFDWTADTEADFSLWRAMAGALRDRFARGLGDCLRIAPPFPVDAGAPVPDGFAMTAMDGWASSAINLTQPLDALHAALKGKWRTAIRRAESAGLETTTVTGIDAVDAFADGHDAFMAAVGAEGGSVDGALLKAMVRAETDAAFSVIEAWLGGAVAGRSLVVRTGDRVEYLAGHTDDAGRAANGGQAMLWRAITEAQSTGAKWFDVGGMDPDRTPKGIYDFKAGLQGTPYRLMSEIDCCGGPLGRIIKARTDRARAAMGA